MLMNMVLGNLLLLVLMGSMHNAGLDCYSVCQLDQVEIYFHALDKVFQKESTVADIDTLLSNLHEHVKYIHVEYEADFDKDAWRAAFIRNLERGAFNGEPERKTGILNVIHGTNHAAVEYSRGDVIPDGPWNKRESLLVLFTFRDGKIYRIEELW
jgi:hypothetical protein